MRAWWRRSAAGWLGVAALLLAAPVRAAPGRAAAPLGQPAPAFSLRKLGGGRLALRDLRGNVVLLAFWMPG